MLGFMDQLLFAENLDIIRYGVRTLTNYVEVTPALKETPPNRTKA